MAEIQGDWELLTLVRTQHQAAIRAAREAYETLSPERPLESLYGVGRQGAAVFTAALASHTFATADKFRGYTGLIPRVKESGLSLSRGQQITKAGPRWLKAQLYVAAETARRYDPQLAVIYYQERVQKGHGHTQAVVTVATHLADRIWKVYHTGQPYELRDVEGRPVTSAEARALIAERWTVPKTRRRARQAGGLTVGGVAQTRDTPASA